ncbi:MAG: rane-associated protein [Deltaproteobacteria bacterium]|nr:rane-associated protein [Deltaproteobacteria bacterium]
MVFTSVKRTCRASWRGISSRSFPFRPGMITWSIPARSAASAFSFTPPMGRTRPRRVTSPVIATSLRTGIPVREETRAVAIVMPAEGPSFGIPPDGTWMWMSCFAWKFRGSPRRGARERT